MFYCLFYDISGYHLQKMDETLSYKTVFVQNIPSSCTNDHLIEVFSVNGPIKEAFVVKPKISEDTPKKKYFGFVTYHSHDDAKSAVNSSKTFQIDEYNLKVTFAKKKKYSKTQTKKLRKEKQANSIKKHTEKDSDLDFEIVPVETTPVVNSISEPKTDSNKQSESVSNFWTVIITGFPLSYTILDFVNLWKVKGLDLPEKFLLVPNNSSNNEAHALMHSKQSALKIVSRLNGITLGDVTFKATLQINQGLKEFRKSSKRSRLIVRNLCFTCSEDDLRNAFEKFGTITDVKIPLKPNGKMFGYGFVQLSHVFEAMKAIKEINMTMIKGRKVAVDWALPREKYKQINQLESNDNDSKVDIQSLEDTESDGDREVDDDNEPMLSEESSDDNEEDSGISEEKSDEEDSEDEVDSDEEDDLNKEADSTKEKKIDKNYSSDVHEGKTVFLRNLHYDVDEDELLEIMKKFGDITYCKIVMNPNTGFSKGSAFVQFISKDTAEECVKTLKEEETKLILHGREVIGAIAQSRNEAKKIVEKNKSKEKEDKRNLYLANEGLIRPGTQAAIGLSEIELKKREKIELAKRQKLKNPHVFVSTTRLCVHNVPRVIDNLALKNIFFKALGGGKQIRITESRVMRDLRNVNEKGVGRSLGFAFVNFTKHEQALRALRSVNNNPEIFGANKRPIVEFALENQQALDLKMQRRKRQLARNALQKKMKSAPSESPVKQETTTSKKERRIQNLREKRKEERKSKLEGNSRGVPTSQLTADVIKGSAEHSERKSFQGSSCMTQSGKKLKMSKHIGPKIRKRDKGKILEQLKNSKKLNKKPGNKNHGNLTKQKQKHSVTIETDKQSTRSRKRALSADVREDQEFNRLVAKYTKKFQNNPTGAFQRPKWYDK